MPRLVDASAILVLVQNRTIALSPGRLGALHAPGTESTPGREVALGRGQRVPYPVPSTAAATVIGKANRRTDTKPEQALRSALHRRGLRFRKDFLIRAGGVRTHADAAFTRRRLAVFVDGCFWHCCPQHGSAPRSNTAYWGPKLQGNVERDRRVTAALEADAWTVLRIWEHVPVDEAADLVQRTLTEMGP